MSPRVALLGALVASFGALLSACEARPPDEGGVLPPADHSMRSVGREPLEALPAPPAIDPRLVRLGRRLFHDVRLSADDTLSCASCHDLARAGDDGRAQAVGIHGVTEKVNAPTVFNAGLRYVLSWDGRAASLEDQARMTVTDPTEMGATWPQVLGKLRADPSYVAAFAELSRGVTEAGVAEALASFVRTLLTEGSPFDRWLRGDAAAMTADQIRGYELFKAVGCVACHQGKNVGGNMFQRFGVFGDYFEERGNLTQADYGRFNVTGDEADRFVFRVPSLRDVARTAPYLHDGRAPTLEQAVQTMAEYQLGRTLTDDQVSSIVAFLSSLSGGTPATARDDGEGESR